MKSKNVWEKVAFWRSKDPKSLNEKNQNVSSDIIRIRVYDSVGNVPNEIYTCDAVVEKDKYNNRVIVDEESGFKEEFPKFVDPLVSDIKSKLESYGLSREEQIKKIRGNIKQKELVLSKSKNGKLEVTHRKDGKSEEININVETEKATLDLLQVSLYSLLNKNREGSYFKIEADGIRCLSYLIVNEGLIPYWHNTPTINGEPVTLTPDMSLRKKYFYDNEQERLEDLREMVDNPMNKLFKLITMALFVVLVLANIGWTIYNFNVTQENAKGVPEGIINNLKLDIAKTQKVCTDQVANQVSNNGVVIDWASMELKKRIDEEKVKASEGDKANLKI